MKTIGQLLRQSRLKEGKSIVQLSKETKIPRSTLEAIENDNFGNLPASPFVKGFIRNYAQAVNLDPEKALATFRRGFTANESEEIIPPGLTKPLNEPSPWFRKIMVIGALSLVIGLFIFYLGWQLKSYWAPPKLTITQPKAATVLKGPLVEVKGLVSADSSVTVNDQLAETFPNGEFRVNVYLLPGKNTLDVKAKNRQGKITAEQLAVEVVDK
ncbi:hypothetical protein A2160_00840 [Candidatus Beckwithbacteria bacterium RBG_13_42_9]|uniref:HTH cro/C1-type domain-containing protein n=1 Tax=Candidatus Beckwithbacteria bacterium RBG_13_42_9 TaxID=1797457 RepID=A0A1F5E3E4_9BACT|nr:MAG: hypothetical protein A2160_00840 [Candidatus Beckwithbacteria bacterium RBG_13_42_9]